MVKADSGGSEVGLWRPQQETFGEQTWRLGMLNDRTLLRPIAIDVTTAFGEDLIATPYDPVARHVPCIVRDHLHPTSEPVSHEPDQSFNQLVLIREII